MQLNLDANASYGLLPEVVEFLHRHPAGLHNPSAVHTAGQNARNLIENAREELALLLELGEDYRIVFTSGATEANHTALAIFQEIVRSRGASEARLVTQSTEHPSVLEAFRYYSRTYGAESRVVAWDDDSDRFCDRILSACRGSQAVLLSLMAVNNETGAVLPCPEALSRARSEMPSTVITHCDAVQAVGKMVCTPDILAADLLTVSGHKIGALPGVGALIVNRRLPAGALLRGGPQELRYRAGTENVTGIVTLGIAARYLRENLQRRIQSMTAARNVILDTLLREIPEISVTTPADRAVCNTLHLRIAGVRADDLVVALDLGGLCVSSGSACASGKPEPSHVLLALGFTPLTALECVRISVRDDLSIESARSAALQIARVLREAPRSVTSHANGAARL